MTKEVDYENPWIYEGAPFTSDDIGDYYGFVYRITNTTTQKSYIGRKYFVQKRKPRGAKRRVTSESDGKDSFRREILSLHKTLGKVNYEETKQLFIHNVLMEALDDGTPMYYNSNILGRYMRKDYGNFEKNSE